MNYTKQILEILGIQPYKYFRVVLSNDHDGLVSLDPNIEGCLYFDEYFVLYKDTAEGSVRMGEYIPDIVAGLLTIQYVDIEEGEDE